MIYGCGVDMEEISRFEKFLNQPASSPFSFVFTKKELENYRLFNEPVCLTLGFSCKEAFFKAFGKSWANSNIDWKDIELIFLSDPEKKEYLINFHAYTKKIIQENNIMMPATTAYTIHPDYVIFETILVCRER